MKKEKRFLISALSLLLFLVFAFVPLGEIKVSAGSSGISSVPGDANGDEKVNTKDVLIIRQFLGALIQEDGILLHNADVNDSERVEIKDVLKIRRYLGGIDPSLGKKYTVMTYNVGQWYNGTGSLVPQNESERYIALHKNIIDNYSPDILCIQEFCEDIIPGDSAALNFLSERYPFMITAKGHTVPFNYAGKAICSEYPLEDGENDSLENDPVYDSPNYEKAYVWLNGRRVCIISAHPAAHPYVALMEMNVIAEDVKDEEYFIICADTNINMFEYDYNQALKSLFDVRGVNCRFANGGEFDSMITYPRTEKAIDNIITSSNIIIDSVEIDKQKDEFFINDPNSRDHYPLIAKLYVN